MKNLTNAISPRTFDGYKNKGHGDYAYLVEALEDGLTYKKGEQFTLAPQFDTTGARVPDGEEVTVSALGILSRFRVVAAKAAGYKQADLGDYQ